MTVKTEACIIDFIFTLQAAFSLLGEHDHSLKSAFWKVLLRKT